MWSTKHESSFIQNNVLRFLFLEIVFVVLMFLDYTAKIASPIRVSISVLTYPLVKIIEWPQNAYDFIKSTTSNQAQLLTENVNLKQKLSKAQVDLLQLEVITQQNQELRSLLNAKQQLPLETSAAFLIKMGQGNLAQNVVINQGYNQGVRNNQTVLDLNGVVGQVSSVELESAHVILITNKNHALPVEILRTGVRSFIYGTGDLDRLSLPEIPQSADLKIGDIIITSGYGGVFPRGLRVASLNKVIDSEDKSFQKAEAKPSADFNNLKQVLLVWSAKQKQAKPEQ